MPRKAPSKASPTSYLRRINLSWYVRVKVPRPLQGAYGNTHVLRALHTRDLDEANRMKWALVGAIKKGFEETQRSLATHPGGTAPRDADADAVRAHLVALRAAGDREQAEALEWAAADHAEGLERSTRDTGKAERWFQIATGDTPALDELVNTWLDASDYTNQTKQQHRAAYLELREFMKGDALPAHVTDELALDFVEQRIRASGKRYNTQRRKVNSLVAFWKWLGRLKHVPRTVNPWRGHELSNKRDAASGEALKRAYRDDELLVLLGGAPAYPALRDIVVLGLYTGARLEELCSLRSKNVRLNDAGVLFLDIKRSKTKAGVRSIAVVHPLACSVLSRRAKRDPAEGDALLFPELAPGGYDDKLSWAVSKAFGRYKRARGMSEATDFHSFRRNVITALENHQVSQVDIARYVGHEFPTMAASVYSAGSNEQTSIRVAGAVSYSAAVEKAAAEFAVRAEVGAPRRGSKGARGAAAAPAPAEASD